MKQRTRLILVVCFNLSNCAFLLKEFAKPQALAPPVNKRVKKKTLVDSSLSKHLMDLKDSLSESKTENNEVEDGKEVSFGGFSENQLDELERSMSSLKDSLKKRMDEGFKSILDSLLSLGKVVTKKIETALELSREKEVNAIDFEDVVATQVKPQPQKREREQSAHLVQEPVSNPKKSKQQVQKKLELRFTQIIIFLTNQILHFS